MSASQWRSAGYLKDHKIRKTNSKEGQPIDKIRKDFVVSSYYFDSVTQNQTGKYAIARFEIATDEFEAAWSTVFGGWLPESGFVFKGENG